MLLERHPGQVALLSMAASAAYGLGRLPEARDLLKRALELKPDSASLRKGLDQINKRLGE